MRDVIVTDFGVVELTEKVLVAYTGEKTVEAAMKRGKGMKRRRQAVERLNSDVQAAHRLFWSVDRDLEKV